MMTFEPTMAQYFFNLEYQFDYAYALHQKQSFHAPTNLQSRQRRHLASGRIIWLPVKL